MLGRMNHEGVNRQRKAYVYALVAVLAPGFGRSRPLSRADLAAISNRADVDFEETARLVGYRVTPTKVKPGDAIEVTLYWEPLAQTEHNHAVFVHLLSEAGTMVAQRDTYPGLGSYLTTSWEPGAAFADVYRVHIPETAYTPDEGYIQVGVYRAAVFFCVLAHRQADDKVGHGNATQRFLVRLYKGQHVRVYLSRADGGAQDHGAIGAHVAHVLGREDVNRRAIVAQRLADGLSHLARRADPGRISY